MSQSVLTSMFGSGWRFIATTNDALPKDARVVAVRFNAFDGRSTIDYLIASDDFPEVPEWEAWPEINPRITCFNPMELNTKEFAQP